VVISTWGMAARGVEPRAETDSATQTHVRTIVVPSGIVAVPRRSPLRVRKRTPWRPQPDGTTTVRSGGRDWFSDRLFVEGKKPHARFSFGTSFVLHACAGVLLSVALWIQLDPLALPRKPPAHVMSVSLTMPFEVPSPIHATTAPPRPVAVPKRAQQATLPAAPAPLAKEPEAAPIEAPAGIEPESASGSGSLLGVSDGVEGGVVGGIPGGVSGGSVAQAAKSDGGPLQVGRDVKAPKKLKDVRPGFPSPAMAARVQGTVIVDITIGPDGRVHSTQLLKSVPLLDDAALEAVRQWEYAPTIVDGKAVAVLMTVTVHFSLQ
jgi:periplasmic protein TonB